MEYSEYLAESVNKGTKPGIMTKEINESINEGKRTSGFSGNYTSLTSKVDSLIESVNKKETDKIINEKNYPFLNLVDERTREGFLSLNEAEKQKVVKALNEQSFNSGTDVAHIMGSALTEQVESGEKFLDMIPEDLVPAWESLNEGQKNAIVAQSKFYNLSTPYQINNFWRTRGLKAPVKPNLEQINESQESTQPDTNMRSGVSNDYLQNISEALGKRFKK
jgi:hypothetical protein